MSRTINAGHIRAKRRNILRNLVTELLLHGHISTTASRKPYVQKMFDQLITLAKKEDLHSIRLILKILRKNHIHDSKILPLQKLQELAKKYKKEKRNGGYLKVYNLGPRTGDNATIYRLQII